MRVRTMKRNNTLVSGLFGVMILLFSALSSHAGLEDFDIPYSPKKWINGGPYSQAALKNKTVVFYFFEEN